jgi:hypothetical protein
MKSPKVAKITSSSLAGWTGATAAYLFLAYKVVDEEHSSRPTLLQGSGKFRFNASEPGTVEHMEDIASEYSSMDSLLGIGSFLKTVLDKKIQTTRQKDSNYNVVTDMESNIGTSSENECTPAAKFPSLVAQIVNDNNKSATPHFQINSSSGFPIENDLFVGKIILVLRPLKPEDDPQFKDRLIDAQKTFEIQIQGKFKRVPRGQMYMGGQITEPISLGGMTKGISNLLLRLLSRHVGANLAYSFGTDHELPHISFPLITAMENVLITKPHENIPTLGQPFVESQELKQCRMSGTKDIENCWNLEDTYSMSYSAKSIDLSTWRITKPCEINLGRLWGKSALRLIIYEKHQERTEKNNYLLALQMQFLGVASSLSGRGDEPEVDPSYILARGEETLSSQLL